jgi:hypothetical protein
MVGVDVVMIWVVVAGGRVRVVSPWAPFVTVEIAEMVVVEVRVSREG